MFDYLWLIFTACVVNSQNVTFLNLSENDDFLKTCLSVLNNSEESSITQTNCCLIKLCPYKDSVIKNFPIKSDLFGKLCSKSLFLENELKVCVFANIVNSEVNNHTNFRPNKGDVVANCSANFRSSTVTGEAALINSKITGDSKKGLSAQPINCTLSPSIISRAPYVGVQDKEIRFENITKISARISGLQFLDVPKGDEMRIYNLRLEEEYLLFEAFSSLMGYLQLNKFPTDLVWNALKDQLPFHLFLTQLLKTEWIVLGWIFFLTVLTFCLPVITITYLCCTDTNIRRLYDESSDMMDFRDQCRDRTLNFLLHFILILLAFPIIAIIVANEQISKQMSNSITSTNIMFEDVNTFIRNTHMQMSFITTSSTDITVEQVRKDLEDVEKLLGQPFQKELADETGINTAFEALDELNLATFEVLEQITDLLSDCSLANAAGNLLQEQLKEVARSVTIVRQQCRVKDRALCYTVQYTGLEVGFSCGNLSSDVTIQHLERVLKEQNFNKSIEDARQTFDQVPQSVVRETVTQVGAIKNILTKRRTEVYRAAHSLDELSRSLAHSVSDLQNKTSKFVDAANLWEISRWLLVLGISTIVSLVWALLLCGAPCGCQTSPSTISYLLAGTVAGAFTCLLVWSLGIGSFVIGEQTHNLVCRHLYDQPKYRILGEILNSGGALFADGVFHNFQTIDDPIRIENVLRDCQRNRPAYGTFHLYNLFDVNSVTNYKSWQDLKAAIANFTIGENNVEILSPALQLNLQLLSTVSSANLTKYRGKVSQPLTKRDLNSFADQLNTVARQLTDLASSQRFDNLASMVRKIIQNEMARFSQLKERILYRLTVLEIRVQPLAKQANYSLTQLKNVQFFIDNQRRQIAEMSSKQFTDRIETYLAQLHNYTIHKITKEIGKCHSLWEIFHSFRLITCKLVVDPLNCIAVSCFLFILMFLGVVPVVASLVERYRDLNEELLTTITHRRARDGLLIDDEGTWATPPSESADNQSFNNGLHEFQTWISPPTTQCAQHLIPAPTRLSTVASRITAARVPQIPSVSRARSPKRGRRHESLRLIEPICWKTGSLSPKSWL